MKNRKIKLVSGEIVLIDAISKDKVAPYRWYCLNAGSQKCAVTYIKRKMYYMHRMIIGAKKGQIVDHINGNELDNRISNLRICTHAENLRNRGKTKNNTSGFKGVSWDKINKKWTAQIMVNYRSIKVGRFEEKDQAVLAYKEAAEKYHGEFARV